MIPQSHLAYEATARFSMPPSAIVDLEVGGLPSFKPQRSNRLRRFSLLL